jgi:glycerol-3-phosphate acyltransferase PlsY
MDLITPLAAVVAAYLVGSMSFAVVVSRAMGLDDPRTYGSGNPGATNVLRSGNRSAAVLTLALDALKGFVPVWAVAAFGAPLGLGEGTAAAVGLAAFLGHLWPVFFGFKGGKGVATAAGVMMGLNPLLGLAALASWLIVAFFLRYSSLAAIVSAVFAPFFQWLMWGFGPTTAALAVMGALLLWRHGGNIRKLLDGTESRIGQKSAVPPASVSAGDSAVAPATSSTARDGRSTR